MRWVTGLAVLVSLASPLLADDKEVAKKLNGSYDLVSLTVGGKKEERKVTVAIFKDGTVTMKEDGKGGESSTFTVDPAKKPAHIDIVPDGDKDRKTLGIYELKETDKGTELTIAFVLGGDSTRPKDFKGEGKDEMVVKLRKREK
jgi:uncharacterized protein (TIGR03067 family)